jgi:hypothetical protein
MSYKFITLKEADDGKHKYVVTLLNKKTGRENNIKFGAIKQNGEPYEDYTIHKDIKRKTLYETRHIVREDWNDPSTAGFWSKWILWNKPTIDSSLQHTLKQFKLN